MGASAWSPRGRGAAECLLMVRPVVLKLRKKDLDNIVARAHELALRAADRELFANEGVGRRFLDENFSIPRMLANFVACTAGALAGDQAAVRQAA